MLSLILNNNIKMIFSDNRIHIAITVKELRHEAVVM
jgi:hypothetical protein